MGLEPKFMQGERFFERRTLVQLASVCIPTAIMVVFGQVSYGIAAIIYISLQLLAGIDIVLLIIGRLYPRATMWSIRMEAWLGPLPWSKT